MSEELQYILPIVKNTSFNEEDYIVSSCNYEAYNWLKNWPNWGESVYNRITLLFGDELSGKSHLASIWQSVSGAQYIDKDFLLQKKYLGEDKCYILENLELDDDIEIYLFHFINYIVESRRYLLITSRTPLYKVVCHLKDLESRLKALSSISIKELDEDLIEKVIIKYFSDLQVSINYDAVKFLKVRINRSYKELFSTLERINKDSLSQKKKISINFIKQVLQI